jgi:hypothetical protein
MNILKLQNELKGVPDDALIGYVQNPTGNVPSYLALSELQRRKDMREKYQAQQAPQSSVADDLQQPAAPQVQPQQAMPEPQAQGVAGLPVPDQMFSGQGMAAGGIVAFDDGGDVSNYRQDQASLNLDRLPSLNLGGGKYDISGRPEGVQKLVTGFGMAGDSPNVNPGFRVFSKMMSGAFGGDPEMIGAFQGKGVPSSVLEGIDFEDYYARNPSQYLPGYTPTAPAVSINPSGASTSAQHSALSRKTGGEIKGYADGGMIYPDFNVGAMPEESTFGQMFRRLTNVPTAKESLDLDAELNRLSQERAKYGVNPFSSISKEDRAFKKQKQQEYTDKMNQLFEQKRNLGKPGGYVPTESPMKSPAQVQADQEKVLAQEKENAIKNVYAPKGGAASAREGVKSLSDYAKEFRDVVGEDPMQAKLAARMEKMDAASAKQAEQAPWMALAQAGFGIAAGKSPYALQNIATGAMEGVKSYGDAQDKMAALEDKRFALMNDMAKAQRAEQLAIASKGVDSRDAQLARDQTERLNDKKMANDMQIHLLDNAFDLKKTQLTTAAKDLPNATERATKIKPLVLEHPDYKPRMKALIASLGDKSVEPGSPKYKQYITGKEEIEADIYKQIISRPGAGAGATMNYVPGKGFSF